MSHQTPRPGERERHTYQAANVAPGEREAERLASVRAWEALMLAKTPEAWAQLLKGQPVPVDQLDHQHLARLRRRKLAS